MARTHQPHDADARDKEGDEDVAQDARDGHGDEPDGGHEWLVFLILLVEELARMRLRRFLMDNRRIAVRQDEDNKAYLRPEHPAEEAAPVEERYSHLHGVSAARSLP